MPNLVAFGPAVDVIREIKLLGGGLRSRSAFDPNFDPAMSVLGWPGVPMPNLVAFGPAVWPAIGNTHTDRHTDRQTKQNIYTINGGFSKRMGP